MYKLLKQGARMPNDDGDGNVDELKIKRLTISSLAWILLKFYKNLVHRLRFY